MFYEVTLKSHIRVPPTSFNMDVEDAVMQQLNETFQDNISKDFGIVIAVSDIVEVGEGIIIPGDGAAYYDTVFKLLAFKPELQEVVLGNISEITDFGAFINLGPIDGMIHISQTMDDFVSFSKSNVLAGKESKKTLKTGDECKARIIAISYKDLRNPKIGLTMRQYLLGSLNWIKEELKKKKEK
ncbi:MAG: DNA-directed RNA polymerase [Nanoarchaeota archaeon]